MRHRYHQPETSPRQQRSLTAWLVFCSLALFFFFSTAAQAHSHGHGHSAAAHTESTLAAQADGSATTESPSHDDHGHHHSGDPLKDLLTLGHNHVGGGAPGLPPALWFLAAPPHSAQIIAARPQRAPGDSPPDNPFRPPIA